MTRCHEDDRAYGDMTLAGVEDVNTKLRGITELRDRRAAERPWLQLRPSIAFLDSCWKGVVV